VRGSTARRGVATGAVVGLVSFIAADRLSLTDGELASFVAQIALAVVIGVVIGLVARRLFAAIDG